MSQTVVLFGAGNMGFAMLQSWIKHDPALRIFVVEPSDAFRSRAEQASACAVLSASQLPADVHPDLVVLAVKPQMVPQILSGCGAFAASGAAFLSVAAGIRLDAMRSALGVTAPLIRCMPNTPAAVGEGMLALCAFPDVSKTVRELASSLMSASGAVVWIEDEDLMDAVTAISGSGPAYVFHFIEALAEAGRRLGLPDEIAALLARQTVYGASRMAQDATAAPAVLREQVTSPNGTTAAALSVLMEGGALIELMARASKAARDRGVELGREARANG